VLTYSLGSFVVVLAGMWLTLRPPSVRAMLPDTDTIGYEVATLGLGILAAELIVHTLVLTPIIIGLAICLHRSSLVSGLDRSSRTDTKTGLLNNTAWNEHATGVLSRSQRDRQPVTVLFLDLDHFKAVNDIHGHLVGDRVLVAVADCLRQELRGHDGLGRYGGEEFVVILDRLTLPAAQLVADRLRNAVVALRVHDGVQVTVSIGLAHEQPHHGTDLQQLLARADSALYQAKQRSWAPAHRNRPVRPMR
jgi:diguanylate cyclase (GGDEF)-like protein